MSSIALFEVDSAGTIFSLDACTTGVGQAVAVSDSDQKIELINWESEHGQQPPLKRTGQAFGGATDLAVSVTRFVEDLVAVASVKDGKLTLTLFQVNATDKVRKTAESGDLFENYSVQDVTVVRVGLETLFICARNNADKKLRLFWVGYTTLNLTGGSPWTMRTHEGGVCGNAPKACAVQNMVDMVAVAAREESGKLGVISYRYSGGEIIRVSTAKSGSVIDLGSPLAMSIPVTYPTTIVTAAVANGKLVLWGWDVATDGSVSHLAGHGSGGNVFRVSMAPIARRRMMTAVVGNNHKLDMEEWDILVSGNSITIHKVGSVNSSHEIKGVCLLPSELIGDQYVSIVAAHAKNQDKLRLFMSVTSDFPMD
jgi:hypothetical protein